MSATEAERHELYELARNHVNDRYAELIMKSLPSEPDRLATKDDVAFAQAATRADMADMRTELKGDMAELRTELKGDMAAMRAELVDRIETATTRSTRTIVLSLVGSVTAMSIANTLTIALTR